MTIRSFGSLGDLVEEDLHAQAIDLRQDQRVELPISC